jgi:hypothetical protein
LLRAHQKLLVSCHFISFKPDNWNARLGAKSQNMLGSMGFEAIHAIASKAVIKGSIQTARPLVKFSHTYGPARVRETRSTFLLFLCGRQVLAQFASIPSQALQRLGVSDRETTTAELDDSGGTGRCFRKASSL